MCIASHHEKKIHTTPLDVSSFLWSRHSHLVQEMTLSGLTEPGF